MLFLLSEQGDMCLGRAALLLSGSSHCRLLALLLHWPLKEHPAETHLPHGGILLLGWVIRWCTQHSRELGEASHAAPMALLRFSSQCLNPQWLKHLDSTSPKCSHPYAALPLAALVSSLLLSLHFFLFPRYSFPGLSPKAFATSLQPVSAAAPSHTSSAALWVHLLPWAFLSCRTAAFSHQSWFHPPSFRQHCRHSPAFNFPGPCPSENNHCPQGPQITSLVPDKTWINHKVTALTSDFSHRSVCGRGKGIKQSKGVTDIFME